MLLTVIWDVSADFCSSGLILPTRRGTTILDQHHSRLRKALMVKVPVNRWREMSALNSKDLEAGRLQWVDRLASHLHLHPNLTETRPCPNCWKL